MLLASDKQLLVGRSTDETIPRYGHFSSLAGISREEATVLGSQRREELRRQRDYDSTTIGRVRVLLQVGNEVLHDASEFEHPRRRMIDRSEREREREREKHVYPISC